jgi:hypothetical protein
MNTTQATETTSSNDQDNAFKYANGTTIEVVGAPVKSDNGRFRIVVRIPAPNGNDEFIVHRLNKKGEEYPARTAFYCRGYRVSALEKFAKIVN